MSLETYLYWGLAAVVLAAVWLIVRSGDRTRHAAPDIPPPRSRRDELIEARGRIRRQIEVLCNPARGSDYTRTSQQALERLQALLKEIEDELGGARTGPLLAPEQLLQEQAEPRTPQRSNEG